MTTTPDPMSAALYGMDGVIVSPGVPLNGHPIAARAKQAHVPVIGDIELFAQARSTLPPHKVVGITGTNGKSTTTALTHHILKTAGVPTTMAFRRLSAAISASPFSGRSRLPPMKTVSASMCLSFHPSRSTSRIAWIATSRCC